MYDSVNTTDVLKYFFNFIDDNKHSSYYAVYESLLGDLKHETKEKIKETTKEKVIKILKGDFEKQFGISFETFIETYKQILEESPEDLI